MDTSKAAVSAMLDQAAASATVETMRGRLRKLTGNDFSAVASLLNLLAGNQVIADDPAMLGSVDAIQQVFSRLWDDVENLAS